MKIRVLHVDDDAFTREVTHTALTSFGFEGASGLKARPSSLQRLRNSTRTWCSLTSTWERDQTACNLQLVERDAPWVGKVIVSSHRSPSLVDPAGGKLTDVSYIVKSDLASSDQLREASMRRLLVRRSSSMTTAMLPD